MTITLTSKCIDASKVLRRAKISHGGRIEHGKHIVGTNLRLRFGWALYNGNDECFYLGRNSNAALAKLRRDGSDIGVAVVST